MIPSCIFTRRQTYAQDDIELFFHFVQEKCGIEGMIALLTAYHPPILMEFTLKGVPFMDVDDDDFAILYQNLSRVYKNMIVWPINNPRPTAEFPVIHLEQLFGEETQQYNLFLY